MGQIDPISILLGGVLVRGVMVGSRDMFEALNQAVEVAGISPVIDRVFAFDEVKRAYEYLQAAGHMGKVVVTLD
jgi:NADPH:quinone reductase-like Zn-dependent oxidoreductase